MSKVYGCTGGYEPRYIEPHPLSMPYAKPFSCAAYLFFYISEIVSFFLVYKCICFVGMLGLEPRAECLDTHTHTVLPQCNFENAYDPVWTTWHKMLHQAKLPVFSTCHHMYSTRLVKFLATDLPITSTTQTSPTQAASSHSILTFPL
jgi:hypothetical protein